MSTIQLIFYQVLNFKEIQKLFIIHFLVFDPGFLEIAIARSFL